MTGIQSVSRGPVNFSGDPSERIRILTINIIGLQIGTLSRNK